MSRLKKDTQSPVAVAQGNEVELDVMPQVEGDTQQTEGITQDVDEGGTQGVVAKAAKPAKVAKAAIGSAAYPKAYVVSNITPTAFTIPQFSMQFDAGAAGVDVLVTSQDQLNLAQLNINSFNSLNRWNGVDVGVILVEKKELEQ